MMALAALHKRIRAQQEQMIKRIMEERQINDAFFKEMNERLDVMKERVDALVAEKP